jgi:bifunctional non-homologous end joining protein LigD
VFVVPLPMVPMAPTLTRPPFHRDGWVYEEKVDGWRIVAHKDGHAVRLVSRTGNDHTARFPDVAATIGRLSARRLILDGEVAVFDEHLVSRFAWRLDAPRSVIATPPVYVAFDCLVVNGRDLRARPLRERRRVLEKLVIGSDVFAVRRLAADGLEAWTEVQRRGLEGLVAKDDGSPYVGGPTRSWLKVKVRREDRFHIGVIRFEGGEFAGLLVGRRIGRRLRFLGTVELGFGRATVADLLVRSQALRRSTSPFGHRGAGRRVVWLEPSLVAEVSYTGVLRDRLREPVFRGLAGGHDE